MNHEKALMLGTIIAGAGMAMMLSQIPFNDLNRALGGMAQVLLDLRGLYGLSLLLFGVYFAVCGGDEK